MTGPVHVSTVVSNVMDAFVRMRCDACGALTFRYDGQAGDPCSCCGSDRTHRCDEPT